MTEIQKTCSLPMKTKLNQISIKKRGRKRVFTDEERRIRHVISVTNYRKSNEKYREYLKARGKINSKKPDIMIRKNLRARLGRYKIKLNKALPLIWKNKGLIP